MRESNYKIFSICVAGILFLALLCGAYSAAIKFGEILFNPAGASISAPAGLISIKGGKNDSKPF